MNGTRSTSTKRAAVCSIRSFASRERSIGYGPHAQKSSPLTRPRSSVCTPRHRTNLIAAAVGHGARLLTARRRSLHPLGRSDATASPLCHRVAGSGCLRWLSVPGADGTASIRSLHGAAARRLFFPSRASGRGHRLRRRGSECWQSVAAVPLAAISWCTTRWAAAISAASLAIGSPDASTIVEPSSIKPFMPVPTSLVRGTSPLVQASPRSAPSSNASARGAPRTPSGRLE